MNMNTDSVVIDGQQFEWRVVSETFCDTS